MAKVVMSKYTGSPNALVYPDCPYAQTTSYDSLEVICTHPKKEHGYYCSTKTYFHQCPF